MDHTIMYLGADITCTLLVIIRGGWGGKTKNRVLKGVSRALHFMKNKFAKLRFT